MLGRGPGSLSSQEVDRKLNFHWQIKQIGQGPKMWSMDKKRKLKQGHPHISKLTESKCVDTEQLFSKKNILETQSLEFIKVEIGEWRKSKYNREIQRFRHRHTTDFTRCNVLALSDWLSVCKDKRGRWGRKGRIWCSNHCPEIWLAPLKTHSTCEIHPWKNSMWCQAFCFPGILPHILLISFLILSLEK